MAEDIVVRCACSPVELCVNQQPVCFSTVGCFSSLNRDLGQHIGCLSNGSGLDVLLCNVHVNFTCCFSSDEDMCNLKSSDVAWNYSKVLKLALVVPIIFLIALFVYVYRHFAPLKRGTLKSPSPFASITFGNSSGLKCASSLHLTESNSSHFVCDSGSGSGAPFMVQRTIARQTSLTHCIGQGRFGEVWRAICQGEEVAVKIFSSRDGASWARETEVYNTCFLCHPNLLAYYASDMISRGGCTQLWIITAYQPGGSLHDYLKESTVSVASGLRFARSTAAGLAFLHSDFSSSLHAKPSIAHRDIKSKNILILASGETCIADLGLALIQSGSVSRGAPIASPLAGTKRYMAPELLSLYFLMSQTQGARSHGVGGLQSDEDAELCERRNCEHPLLPFEVHRAADVYALGLVFWEITRRIHIDDEETVEDFQLPYFDVVPTNPTFLQMFRVVVLNQFDECDDLTNKIDTTRLFLPLITCPACRSLSQQLNSAGTMASGYRPRIGERWFQSSADNGLRRFVELLQECWSSNWTNRLSALRVRKTLESIEEGY